MCDNIREKKAKDNVLLSLKKGGVPALVFTKAERYVRQYNKYGASNGFKCCH